MTISARQAILTRLRQAFHGLPRPTGPRPAVPPVAPSTADFETFGAALSRLGVPFDLAPDRDAAQALLTRVMAEGHVRSAVRWDHPDIGAIGADEVFTHAGVARIDADGLPERACPALAEVDMGLTGVTYALCATGTLVLTAAPGQRRSIPLVPRLHVALVARSRLLPNLRALVGRLADRPMPSAVTCVSGISSTGDIEFMYVRGVHGPLAAHVIGLDWL